MEDNGFVFAQIMPRRVLREAFANGIIERGQDWQDLLDARNQMSHEYNMQKFESVIQEIAERYIFCFSELYEKLKKEDTNDTAN